MCAECGWGWEGWWVGLNRINETEKEPAFLAEEDHEQEHGKVST